MSTVLFTATVMGQPIPQSRPRVTRTGRVFYGKRATAQRSLLEESFFYSHKSARTAAIARPVSVLVEVAGMHGNADLDNAAKLVLDSLVDAGVLLTDKATVVRELIVRAIGGVKRTVVTIHAIESEAA